ncbi:unnamed protein product [Dicrocoelium dendriticum]|nr:unnamed protein product [Dicrocoelium dendriticum]
MFGVSAILACHMYGSIDAVNENKAIKSSHAAAQAPSIADHQKHANQHDGVDGASISSHLEANSRDDPIGNRNRKFTDVLMIFGLG